MLPLVSPDSLFSHEGSSAERRLCHFVAPELAAKKICNSKTKRKQ